MTERPILFNGDMVRAIHDGRKVQTRRPMKPQPERNKDHIGSWTWVPKKAKWDRRVGWCPRCVWQDGVDPMESGAASGLLELSPFGAPGDLLWMRSAYRVSYDETRHLATWSVPGKFQTTHGVPTRNDGKPMKLGGKPAMHMPRWLSYHLWPRLLVKRVWVERVQSISEKPRDAWAEGCRCECTAPVPQCAGNVKAFEKLWTSIYADKYPWESDPFVWACEFEVQGESNAID